MNLAPRPFVLALLLASLASLPGCGDTKAKEPAKEKTPVAASPAQTPEELAKQVVATLKANDFKAFRALCVTKEQVLAMAKNAKTEKERVDNEAYAEKRFTPDNETKLQAHFDFAVKQVDWNSVQAGPITARPEKVREGQPPMINSITVELSDKWKLTIKDSIKLDTGWIIGDDNPIYIISPNGKTLFPPSPETKPAPAAPPAPTAPKNPTPPTTDGKTAPPPAIK